MNVLPNPQTNGITGLLQGGPGGAPQGMPPQGMPPQGMPPQGMPPQGVPPPMPPQAMPSAGGMPPRPPMPSSSGQQNAPLDPRLLQAFENMKLRAAADRQKVLQKPQKPPVVQQLQAQVQQVPQQMGQQIPQQMGQQIPGMASGGIVAFSAGGWENMAIADDETPEEFVARVEAARESAFKEQQLDPFSAMLRLPGVLRDAAAPKLASMREGLLKLRGPGAYPEGPKKPRAKDDENDVDRYKGKGSPDYDDAARYKNKGIAEGASAEGKMSDDALRAVMQAASKGDASALQTLTTYAAKFPTHLMRVASSAETAAPAAPKAKGMRPPTGPAVSAPTDAAPAAPAAPAAAPAAPETGSIRELLERRIRANAEVDPSKERDTQAEWARKQLGLDALLGEQEQRYKALEEKFGQRRQPGLEDWLLGLATAKPDRNAGSGFASAGAAYRKAQADAQAADLDFAMKMAGMRDNVTKTRIEGNKLGADAGMKGYEAGRRMGSDAITGMRDLVTTDENNAARLQAKEMEAAARRFQIEQQSRDAAARRGDIRYSHDLALSRDERQRAQLVLTQLGDQIKALQTQYQQTADPEVKKQLDSLTAMHRQVLMSVMKGVPGSSITEPQDPRKKDLTPEIKKRALEINAEK